MDGNFFTQSRIRIERKRHSVAFLSLFFCEGNPWNPWLGEQQKQTETGGFKCDLMGHFSVTLRWPDPCFSVIEKKTNKCSTSSWLPPSWAPVLAHATWHSVLRVRKGRLPGVAENQRKPWINTQHPRVVHEKPTRRSCVSHGCKWKTHPWRGQERSLYFGDPCMRLVELCFYVSFLAEMGVVNILRILSCGLVRPS